jgi:hypothetical protein
MNAVPALPFSDWLTGVWRRHWAEPFGRLGRHWFLFALLIVFPFLAIWGYIGVVYGLPLHFREDQSLGSRTMLLVLFNSPSFFTHAFTTFFAGLFWLSAAAMNPEEDPQFRKLTVMGEMQYLAVRMLPVSALMLYAAAVPISKVVPAVGVLEFGRCLGGIGLGLATFAAFAMLTRWVAGVLKWYRIRAIFSVLVLLLVGLHFFPKLLTVISLFKLAGGITAFYIVVNQFKLLQRTWIFLLVVAVPLFVGGSDRYKYSFPAMERLYANPVRLQRQVATPSERAVLPADDEAAATVRAERLTPVVALERFGKHQVELGQKLDGRRLVVVATSGGAYRATFWTALVLDRLRRMSSGQEAPGLANAVKLITGASGGMVGGAYFATLDQPELAVTDAAHSLVALISKDIRDRQAAQAGGAVASLNLPLPRDSLTDVAQELTNGDALRLFWPGSTLGLKPLEMDRGRVLQAHWARLGTAHGKDFTFQAIAKEVAAGIGPSLIVSPMLVETGQPLLISDLDLAGIADPAGRNTMDFFDTFPGVWDKFTVQTAVRMSATFPYVAPAVALPTDPPRRVVDAGYFDNYGMTAALSYLRQPAVRNWMKVNKLSGAIIVQINAFPVLITESVGSNAANRSDADCAEPPPYDGADPLGWLISPLEGLSSARERSMVFRSEQGLGALSEIYRNDGLQLTRIAFENAARSSFSWYLPDKDFNCMTQELGNDANSRAFDNLGRAWQGDTADLNWPER